MHALRALVARVADNLSNVLQCDFCLTTSALALSHKPITLVLSIK